MIVSSLRAMACRTAALALAPECGWTFAYSASNSCFNRSIAICSTSSTTSQPP